MLYAVTVAPKRMASASKTDLEEVAKGRIEGRSNLIGLLRSLTLLRAIVKRRSEQLAAAKAAMPRAPAKLETQTLELEETAARTPRRAQNQKLQQD